MQDKRLGRSRSAYRLRPTSNGQARGRSEEHTSELQSLRHLVCRLLLEKKKKKLNSEQFKHELKHITWLVQHRRKLTPHSDSARFVLPWIVHYIQRQTKTHRELDNLLRR